MAKGSKPRSRSRRKPAPARAGVSLRDLLGWAGRGLLGLVGLFLFLVLAFTVANPVFTPYMIAESWRHGGISRDWVDLEDMAPEMARSVVAAEDANFCLHWGFDMHAIRAALDEGAGRGASTITQQVVKNVFLWQGRSWPRKALEALMTPVVELFWTKRRIVEVYLNVAETGKGLFGAEAAAKAYFGRSAADLTPSQAALVAAALPDPKGRNPGRPSGFLRKRAAEIADGAATIRADGRADCFED
ncbi:MAG: monofunctional biosynthetic peptidoglycan transglycosylase [Rhodobacteraceae bacterium]|jgi:monofunctional biosynthetic peptidoglycan transglycosylase|uniref:monofunctional biosynthetic peptidoglycan transglycosylase n=1 Tax=Albidovulum sp. TaxID=1872424 RepID=UPI001D31314A|nr:monofunctional biosynthetic peptidoglycan transglycosylase [uncultured Defluviimonas sp.]MCB2124017.1 monofunctional biosynthetic peptidoglycan transglycosylase [Paracoccaceae bacterium]MCC0070735.1 monofunctional biosynthetic peptidoglycan transglycosylase [Paracoccaceae bacterium]